MPLGSGIFNRHFRAVGLNRCEDALLAYLRTHPDEERFWRDRVLTRAASGGSLEDRTASLERELRAYTAERAVADTALAEALGGGTVRLRTLAEFLLANWPPPRPQAKKPR